MDLMNMLYRLRESMTYQQPTTQGDFQDYPKPSSIDKDMLRLMSPHDLHTILKNEQIENLGQIRTDLFSGFQKKGGIQQRWRVKELLYYSSKSDNIVKQLEDPVYNLKLTNDQRTMIVGTQETMNIFDCENGIKLQKTLQAQNIQWTMTDLDISDDSTFSISCSLNPYVTLYDIQKYKILAVFSFSNEQEDADFYDGLRLYSCKMSADKTALLGGSGRVNGLGKAFIKYFDIQKNTVTHSIPAHQNDINTIGFVQREQTQVFLSGSDDDFVKVWDVRALGISQKPVGKFYGHFAGVTYVESRGDGVYVCSNSKDQSTKLWDLRNSSNDEKLPHKSLNFDYRHGRPQRNEIDRFKGYSQSEHADQSVSTFRSHAVVRTLIRCHFSPKATTNSEYIISASACGRLFIYSIFDANQRPIIISPKTNGNNQKPLLDTVAKKAKMQVQDNSDEIEFEEEDEESSFNPYQGDDDGTLSLVRDVAWADFGIVTGDFNCVIREFRSY